MDSAPLRAGEILTDPALRARDRRRITRRYLNATPPPRSIKYLLGTPLALVSWGFLYQERVPELARAALSLAIPAAVMLTAWLTVRLIIAIRNANTRTARRRMPGASVHLGSLSEPARDLLRRARTASRSVTEAAVCRDGHLGDQAALRDAEWHIARTLRDTARLQAAHDTITGHGRILDPCVDAIAAPQRDVIVQVLDSITGFVGQLEEYAARVAAANAAYTTWLQARALAELNSDLLDLLATTAGTRVIDGEIGAMTHQAETAEHTFRVSLDDALACALAIPQVPYGVPGGA